MAGTATPLDLPNIGAEVLLTPWMLHGWLDCEFCDLIMQPVFSMLVQVVVLVLECCIYCLTCCSGRLVASLLNMEESFFLSIRK